MITMKKITALLTSAIMVFTLNTSVFAEQLASSADKPSEWAVESVEWSGIYGIVPEEMFWDYTRKVTREELYSVCVSIYERITNQIVIPNENNPYTDTDSENVLKAYTIGILDGTGKFEPEKVASRLDMVRGTYKAIKAAQPDFDYKTSTELKFKDASTIPQESVEMVKYIVAKGILNGRSSTILDLDSPCNRQELMVFARKAYEFVMYEAGKDSKGAFWKVSDEDSSVYLLGSIHLAEPSMYPLSKDILEAFEEADYLAVEADVSNQQEAALYMLQKAFYTDDNTLYKNVPKEVYDQFVKVIEPMGMKPEFFNKLKPWYAALLVQNLAYAENSLSAEIGIDMYFMNKAAGRKEILEIEGIKFQVDMFDSFSPELQAEFLASSLGLSGESQEESMDQLNEMIALWKAGNVDELGKILKSTEAETEAMKEFNEKLWYSRDTNMAQKVRTYLADPEGKTYFVMVGAGHMVGENGVIDQLDDDYKVEHIK